MVNPLSNSDKPFSFITSKSRQKITTKEDFLDYLKTKGNNIAKINLNTFDFQTTDENEIDFSNVKIEVTDELLSEIVTYCPHLKMLDIKSCKQITAKIIPILASLAEFKKIKLTKCLELVHQISSSIDSLKHLEVLNVTNCDPTLEDVKSFISHPRIKKLNLKGCQKLSQESLDELSSSNLEFLILRDCNLNDKNLEFIFNLKKLKIIILTENAELTDQTIPLLSSLPNLKRLNIKACPQITEEALIGLREKRVKIIR